MGLRPSGGFPSAVEALARLFHSKGDPVKVLLGRFLLAVSMLTARLAARLGRPSPVVQLLVDADRRLDDAEQLSALAAEALPALAQSVDYWQTRAADAECLAGPVTPADLE